MRPEVHAAALRSAAKLVLGMASIASVTVACAATSEESDANTQAVTAKNDGSGDGSPTTTSDDAGTPLGCQATLNAAFPGPDRYGTDATKEPKDVVACCDEALAGGVGAMGHRWACCNAYDQVDADGNPETVSRKHGMACTPWGPPVPPRMNRRAKKASPARRDMNAALLGLVA